MDPRLSIIYARRSIRRFTGAAIAPHQLQELLKAAMAAPSAHNCQAWQFVLITDEAARQQIAQRHPYAAFASEAAAVIVVCGDSAAPLTEHNLAAATQNILLAATALGLGACWCGITPERAPTLREIAGTPADCRIGSLVCVGVPAEQKEPRTQYTAAKVHWQRFGTPLPAGWPE